ncbi:hypothetical protein AMTR_s00207p00032710 [Amborella trichopoda]|uniref:Uncharacterized protein n=1 Tax=Amborella trichopoda TaxID=13333 RepID=W1NZH6_AMBTC|nr:hypothetical protein AMTR_s00207p00032710 [Amborella trichopoda]
MVNDSHVDPGDLIYCVESDGQSMISDLLCRIRRRAVHDVIKAILPIYCVESALQMVNDSHVDPLQADGERFPYRPVRIPSQQMVNDSHIDQGKSAQHDSRVAWVDPCPDGRICLAQFLCRPVPS